MITKTKTEIARERFQAFDTAWIEHTFRGAADPDPAAFGYYHGWIEVDGECFNRDQCFGFQPTYDGP